jgi:flagellar biosynthesis protein FliR
MPQINVLSVGFIFKILCGLGAVAVSLTAMQQAAGDEIHRVLAMVFDWARGA